MDNRYQAIGRHGERYSIIHALHAGEAENIIEKRFIRLGIDRALQSWNEGGRKIEQIGWPRQLSYWDEEELETFINGFTPGTRMSKSQIAAERMLKIKENEN
jgi:hypothetical protein